ncbi:hypothetical protein FJ936_09215 [Mesorhizobium sp. B2-4-13]|uniref:hypothetical protein n=1 Tax=Mesorhizobium sp. B2-4-13 TaxID=2589936 RepID=UPI001151236D|nr:hypothetical protein [Mesorhizobium sp. B2-4-13]TPK85707.1 hypothetical protein FJ936_09215 [Mesorhizobium sp. B2-4-13]
MTDLHAVRGERRSVVALQVAPTMAHTSAPFRRGFFYLCTLLNAAAQTVSPLKMRHGDSLLFL